VIFVPTPEENRGHDAARWRRSPRKDIVYDLGAATGASSSRGAEDTGARGVGIDIDPQRISEANANAKTAGVTGQGTVHTRRSFEATSARRRW
jgi:methylase of polypeptide subunit release factors